ncbi:glycosyltransferase family 4 protein [Haloplanus pelagicus]|uniref:glycosyltransferase family 4 protein n=1 Tax=Haloplanus pelagicus TaxID=2949995 RepID=UPI00203FA806|nr:glycosyltransferase family 4 protein [Haloplanus sp. HW8-1]
MHVVHLYDGHEKVYDGRGSVPGVVWNLARETVARGHEVTVVERQWRDLDVTAAHEGVAFHRLALATGSAEPWDQLPYEMVSSPLGAVRLIVDRANFARAAVPLLAHHDPDVIHVHLPFAANVLVTVASRFRDRLVYTAHLGETEQRVVEPRVSPDVYLAKRAARTIALNPSMHEAFADRGVSEGALETIPNGVDTTQFDGVTDADRAGVAERFGVDADVVALFVGTVTPRKGVLELARAAGRIFPVDADAEVVVVGNTELDAEYVQSVEDAITEAGIDDDVTLTGFVSERDLAALYDLGDVVVLPSYEEGSSIAVAEALAAGTPVIGTRIDGIRQQIDHGRHGLLSEPGDVDELSRHLETLLTDDERRETMAAAVDERAHDLSWSRITGDVLDVYREVAA